MSSIDIRRFSAARRPQVSSRRRTDTAATALRRRGHFHHAPRDSPYSVAARQTYQNLVKYWSSMASWGAHTLAFLSSTMIEPRPAADGSVAPPGGGVATGTCEGFWVIRERRSDKYGTMYLPDPEEAGGGTYERFVMAFVHREHAEATVEPLRASAISDDLEVTRVTWTHLSTATLTALGVAIFDADAMSSCAPAESGPYPCRIIRRTTPDDISEDREKARGVTAALNRCMLLSSV